MKKNIAIIVAGLIGILGAKSYIDYKIENTIEEKTFNVSIDARPDMFDYNVEGDFVPSEMNLRTGFEYQHQDIELRPVPGEPLSTRKVGTEYQFSVSGNITLETELLVLTYHNSNSFTNYITLTDKDNDMVLDRIYISDTRNNTTVTINRQYNGDFEYHNLNEEAAKILYGFYTDMYRNFVVEHEIKDKMDKYVPELTIKH